jgi:predicted phage tail protein
VQITQLAGVRSYASTGLAPGSVYRYRLRAYNNGGLSAYSNIAEAMLPPPVPASLVVTTVSATELLLRWNDTSGETGFRIERCLGAACSSFAEIGQVTANSVTLTDVHLQSATLYRYRVRAFNTGGSSPPSNVAEGTTQPAAPANLSATAVSGTQINLAWSPVARTTGLRIERCTGVACTNFVSFAQVGPNATSFINTSLTPKVTYRYRVRAVNAGGQSAPSNVAQATTP